jgi:hypothetical protein
MYCEVTMSLVIPFPSSLLPASFQNHVQFRGSAATFVNTINLMVRNCCPSPPANSLPSFVGCPLLIILFIHVPLQPTPVTNTNNQGNIQTQQPQFCCLSITLNLITVLIGICVLIPSLIQIWLSNLLARPCTEHTRLFSFSLLCSIHCVLIKVSRNAVPYRDYPRVGVVKGLHILNSSTSWITVVSFILGPLVFRYPCDRTIIQHPGHKI